MKNVSPSTYRTAFNCPHCGAFSNQTWSLIFTQTNDSKTPTPFLVGRGGHADLDLSDIRDPNELAVAVEWADKMAIGEPFMERPNPWPQNLLRLQNVNTSTCFNCKKHSLWVYTEMVEPRHIDAPPANPDMSADIRRDYEEACAILGHSPRGAAALARLSIQKLCKELGKSGRNINDDIGALVADGLDKRIQQALDVVRVIGNQAVHPGQIDLRDDRSTAETLLKLVNMIVDKLVSEPKHIEELYKSLPEGALKGIADRDKK